MANLRPLVVAARLDQAFLAPFAVFVGSSYAHFDAQPGPGIPAHVVVSLGALAAGIGVNFADHAWDTLGAPPPDRRNPIPESEEPLSTRDAAILAAIAFAVALLCGAILVPVAGAASLEWGLLACVLGILRGAPVVGLDTLGRGLGDVANAVALGPLAVLAGYASQAGHGSTGCLLAGIPAGAIAASALFVRHFQRREADSRHDRLTPVVVLGDDKARQLLVALPVIAGGAVAAIVASGEYGRLAYGALAPMAAIAVAAAILPKDPTEDVYTRFGAWSARASIVALLLVATALRLASPV
jgi:1,4-dihydroxy-2-naphthoate polyprenyltransferase